MKYYPRCNEEQSQGCRQEDGLIQFTSVVQHTGREGRVEAGETIVEVALKAGVLDKEAGVRLRKGSDLEIELTDLVIHWT